MVAGVQVRALNGAPTAHLGPTALMGSLPRDVTQLWTLRPAQNIWQEETVFPLADQQTHSRLHLTTPSECLGCCGSPGRHTRRLHQLSGNTPDDRTR